ncbi:MAG: phenylacetate--CoA ligase family protein, partial [bacterium]
DVCETEDLHYIPFTDKNDLRSIPLSDILSRGVPSDKLVVRVTSGASGRPFLVRRSIWEEYTLLMFRFRAQRQFGRKLRDQMAYVAVGGIPGENRDTFQARFRRKTGICGFRTVNCLQPAEDICRDLEKIDPEIVGGYAGAVAHIAPFADGLYARRKLRMAICGGESVTPAKRRAIENGFGVRLFEIFGCHECNLLAWECPETGLHHVCDDNVVAEVLNNGRPVEEGEKGEVVLTTLHSYSMPFIRYRLGDVVVKGPDRCPCGLPFSTFRKIEGRVREYFRLPDGRRVHPLEVVLSVICENAPWMDQFQMVQETETKFVLLSVARMVPSAEDLQSIHDIVAAKLGPGAEFRVELTDHIPFEPSGKFKDCRSLIEPDEL